MVAGLECSDRSASLFDDTNTFMAKDAPRRAAGHVAFEDVEIGTADRRLDDPNDDIGRSGELGPRAIFKAFWPGPR